MVKKGKAEAKAPKPEYEGEPPEVEDEDWQDVFTDQFKFVKQGDGLTGVLISKESSSFDVGAYVVQIDEEMALSFLGTTVLDRLLKQVPIGHEVQVTYSGDTETKAGRRVKQFAVRHRKAKEGDPRLAAIVEEL